MTEQERTQKLNELVSLYNKGVEDSKIGLTTHDHGVKDTAIAYGCATAEAGSFADDFLKQVGLFYDKDTEKEKKNQIKNKRSELTAYFAFIKCFECAYDDLTVRYMKSARGLLSKALNQKPDEVKALKGSDSDTIKEFLEQFKPQEQEPTLQELMQKVRDKTKCSKQEMLEVLEKLDFTK